MVQTWKYLTEEELKDSPSFRDGVSPEAESRLRRQYCQFITEAGMKLKVPQLTIATATVFCHRFFTRQSMARKPANDIYIIATTCLFLAGKVEETPKQLKDVIIQCHATRTKATPAAAELSKEKYEEYRENVLQSERKVLMTLAFDFSVDHPYQPLLKATQDVANALARQEPCGNDGRNIRQVAWNFLNDGLKTRLSLRYEARQIAVASLYLAGKFLKVKLDEGEEKPWYETLRVEVKTTEKIANQLLDLYDQAASAAPAADAKATGAAAPKAEGAAKAEPPASNGAAVMPEVKAQNGGERQNGGSTESTHTAADDAEDAAQLVPSRKRGAGDVGGEHDYPAAKAMKT